MRKAAVSGQFYESGKKELEKYLKSVLKQRKTGKKVAGLIVPHAGYFYSGKAAASGYSMLQGQKYDTFVILGPNHSGLGSSVSFEDFETPLGVAENDVSFSKELSKTVKDDELAHKNEHCIEVQIPFLQYIFRKIKIVPVLIGDVGYEKCIEIAKEIAKIAEKQKKTICIIASSDFTHYGAGYGFIPFSGNNEEIKRKLYELDKKAISFIEKIDSKGFFEFSGKTTICGRLAITIAIEFCKITRAKARLIDYYTSGDVAKDYRNSVGYASIIFEK